MHYDHPDYDPDMEPGGKFFHSDGSPNYAAYEAAGRTGRDIDCSKLPYPVELSNTQIADLIDSFERQKDAG